MPKVGRDQREKVFISEDHVRSIRLGREGKGAYNLPSSLTTEPKIKFPVASRDDLWGKSRDDPDAVPTNDALYANPDSQPFKYKNQGSVLIGTDARGKLKDAELLKAHSAAFYGRESPGPAGVGQKYGPDFTAVKPRIGPARKFGVKTQQPNWIQTSSLPEEIGPGRYPRNDVSMGKQHLTQRRNQSVHAFPQGPKLAKVRNSDTISQLDAARSCLGKQTLGKNRSMPSINFNCDSRRSREKSMICFTKQDLGPKAAMPKANFAIPTLPPERVILKSGIG